ncbi:hypothetical protein N7450_011698 [Penicillium hetheringtonii]|uniref:Uncharacterized protein n=1 Tax=Penicillium hetheringtonii TaxID=911720 RepID=A0AAD6GN81_9EURO|nr:hypothetical protein N7450_011698 [Penicillium hetheringtonii]
MANYYIHVPSQTEPGALTAKELLYAQMPCYFGIQDCTTAVRYAGTTLKSSHLTADFHAVILSICPASTVGFYSKMPAVHTAVALSTILGGLG